MSRMRSSGRRSRSKSRSKIGSTSKSMPRKPSQGIRAKEAKERQARAIFCPGAQVKRAKEAKPRLPRK